MTPCKWLYPYDDDDTSFTLEFTTLSSCQLVRVAGEGDVAGKHRSQLGDYKSVYTSVLDIMQIQMSPYNAIQTNRNDRMLPQAGGRKVEQRPTGLQES